MSQLYTKDPLKTGWVPGKENVKSTVSDNKRIKTKLADSMGKKIFLWTQIKSLQPQGSTVPGMLCLEEALYRQHTCPLWKKRCVSLPRREDRQRRRERRNHNWEGSQNRNSKGRKQSWSPGYRWFRAYF